MKKIRYLYSIYMDKNKKKEKRKSLSSFKFYMTILQTKPLEGMLKK